MRLFMMQIDPAVTTEFVGYDKLETASTVTVLTSETEIVEALIRW